MPLHRVRGLSIARQTYLLLVLVISAAGIATGASALFAYEAGRWIQKLQAESARVEATATWLHDEIDRQRGLINATPGNTAGAQDDRLGTIAMLSDRIGACLHGQGDCVALQPNYAAKAAAELTRLSTAAADFGAQVKAHGTAIAADRAEFNSAADQLHRTLGTWQDRQFRLLLGRTAALSRDANKAALWVGASSATLMLIGIVALYSTRRRLRQLGHLTDTMLDMAQGRLQVAIPYRTAADEIGRIARALDVFLRTAQQLVARDKELNAVNERLDAALNNMSQGLCMFGADNRLIVWNDRALQMFGIAGLQVAGRSFDELADLVVERGSLSGENAAGIKDRTHINLAGGHPTSYTRELADGRSLSICISPMKTGGWLVTYEDITRRRSAEARIAFMAHHDALTGLANRTLFQTALHQAVAGARQGDGCAVFYIDLDYFKEINDTLGHPIGDQLLSAVSQRLNRAVRPVDLVARLGGDEFAIVQTGINRSQAAGDLAARVSAVLAEPFDLSGHRVTISCSIGIAHAPADGTTADEMMRKADLALYQAKKDGRRTFRSFEPAMATELQQRRGLEAALYSALSDGEFELHYQVQVDLRTRSAFGVEALLRWRRPGRGLVHPDEFVHLAEDTGLIVPIGRWVIRQACADAAKWPNHIKLAVNLSPVQFRTNSLVDEVRAALDETGLAPGRLELEITETAMLHQSERTLRMLHELRALGVCITMDDFGTGYSSLSYLQRFPFSKIKIDQSFVQGAAEAEGSDAILRAVIGLGASLGIDTVAEGIENEQQFADVRAKGCALGQGFLFGEPLPADALLPFILNPAVG